MTKYAKWMQPSKYLKFEELVLKTTITKSFTNHHIMMMIIFILYKYSDNNIKTITMYK